LARAGEAEGVKGIVVYDTYYGNTRTVAEAVAEQVRAEGGEAELHSIRKVKSPPSVTDFLVVGSPIRMGKVTRRARKFVERLDVEAWKGRPIMTFVTMLPPPGPEAGEERRQSYERWDVHGAQQLRDIARARGLSATDAVLMVHVRGMKGPLVEDGVERAKRSAHDFIQSLGK